MSTLYYCSDGDTPDHTCPLCEWAVIDEAFRKVLEETTINVRKHDAVKVLVRAKPSSTGHTSSSPRIADCIRLKEPTGELITCGSCRGVVQLKVFACEIYSSGCTIAKPVSGKACCQTCKDYVKAS